MTNDVLDTVKLVRSSKKHSDIQQRVLQSIFTAYDDDIAAGRGFVLVIHCRDEQGETAASDDCLSCMTHQLAPAISDQVRIH